MSRRTLVFLLALVIALAAIAWRQVAIEGWKAAEADVPLFEGVDAGRVTWFRVENLERDQHMKFQRDPSGRWMMIEPVQVPAEQSIAQLILDSALARRGTPVPEEERDPKNLGLEPPRAILEIEEDVGGTTRRQKIELGALDIDGQHINVRARGRLLRTWRDLDTTLDRHLDDFKTHDAMDLAPQEVLELHRRGSIVQELVQAEGKGPVDLTLDAVFEAGVWRVTAPATAPLDPQAIGLWLRGVTGLHVESYVDHGRRLLSDFGLDPAEMTVTLSTLQERSATLRFGRPGQPRRGEWTCTREGQLSVWGIGDRSVRLIAAPLEDLIDHRIVRLSREAIDGVSLVLGGRELRLWREKDERGLPTWRVAERPAADQAFGPRLQCDAGRIGDLLGRIEQAEIASFQMGRSIPPGEVRGTLVVQAGDEQQGGSFGGVEAGGAIRFQRRGDSLAGLVEPALLDLLATPARELWSLRLVELPEMDQAELSLAADGVERRFVRGSKGLWTPPGIEIEARELRDVLDPLFFLRATRHLGLGPHPALVQPISVEFKSLNGQVTRITIGLSTDSATGETVQADLEGRRAVLKDQDLHRRLFAVLEKRL